MILFKILNWTSIFMYVYEVHILFVIMSCFIMTRLTGQTCMAMSCYMDICLLVANFNYSPFQLIAEISSPEVNCSI